MVVSSIVFFITEIGTRYHNIYNDTVTCLYIINWQKKKKNEIKPNLPTRLILI